MLSKRNRLKTLLLKYWAGGLDLSRRKSLLVPSSVNGVDEAIARRNDVRSAETVLDRARTLKTLAAKGMSPTLDGSVGYTILTDNDNSSPVEKEFLLSLNLSVPLYDGGKTKQDVLDKEETISAAERTLQSRKDQVREDVVKALNQWENRWRWRAAKGSR